MTTTGTQPKNEAGQTLPDDEAAFIADMEKASGRKLTPQEAALFIEQAKAVGEL